MLDYMFVCGPGCPETVYSQSRPAKGRRTSASNIQLNLFSLSLSQTHIESRTHTHTHPQTRYTNRQELSNKTKCIMWQHGCVCGLDRLRMPGTLLCALSYLLEPTFHVFDWLFFFKFVGSSNFVKKIHILQQSWAIAMCNTVSLWLERKNKARVNNTSSAREFHSGGPR